MCASPRVRDTALTLQRLCRPRRHPCKGEPNVQLPCQSWSNSSGRIDPPSRDIPVHHSICYRSALVRLRVFLSGSTSAFVARRGFRASSSRSTKRWFVALISSASSPNFYLVDQNDLTSFPGSCPCPFYRMVFQTFDIGSLLRIRETRFHHDGERGQYPWGHSCSASVVSQGNLDGKDTSVAPSPEKGLRDLRRCIKNISLLAWHVGETNGDLNITQRDEGYRQRTKVIIRRLNTRG